MSEEIHPDTKSLHAALFLIADIRRAVGDPTGKLMQDELVAHCGEVYKRAELFTRLNESLAKNKRLFADGGEVSTEKGNEMKKEIEYCKTVDEALAYGWLKPYEGGRMADNWKGRIYGYKKGNHRVWRCTKSLIKKYCECQIPSTTFANRKFCYGCMLGIDQQKPH